ncbi:glycosyltransferase [Solirubrobacter sp. CPCC 204708]|nr:glycosyltransferase [Solirubrobacter deserti]
MDERRPRVSVITPVRNGAKDIAELLACLEHQTLNRADFEIVIGDDGSTDGGTTGIETPDGHVRVAFGPPRNSYATRNMAVAASRGEVLAFCDADCRPEPDWLERGLAALEGTDLAAGRFRFTLPERITAWTLIDMDGSKDHEHSVRLGLAETANLFCLRATFDRLGGLDGSIKEYGDYEFSERAVAAGARLTYAGDAVVWHPTRDEGKPLLRALWKYNRGYAVHAGRAGTVADGIKLREWVPVVQTYRSRRRFGRSIGPDRRWMRDNDVHPSPVLTLQSLPILYIVVPYLRCAAQLAGWLEGRRMRGTSGPVRVADELVDTA